MLLCQRGRSNVTMFQRSLVILLNTNPSCRALISFCNQITQFPVRLLRLLLVQGVASIARDALFSTEECILRLGQSASRQYSVSEHDLYLVWYSVYFHSLPRLTSLSSCLLRTFAVARSKSSCVTWTLRSLNAYIPASVQTPFNSAPEQPFIFSAILVRLIPLVRFMDRE